MSVRSSTLNVALPSPGTMNMDGPSGIVASATSVHQHGERKHDDSCLFRPATPFAHGLSFSSSGTLAIARSIVCGVYFVPALTGLGAPYWDQYARGALLGIKIGRAHV